MTHDTETDTDRPADPTRRAALGGTLGAAAAAAAVTMGARGASAQEAAGQGSLVGKTAFVTGGARGIGLASAEAMAREGANIVLFDIASGSLPNVDYPLPSEGDLAAAQARIEELGAECMTYQGDVRSLEDQQAAMQQTVDRFGSLDIVLANAGVGHAGAIGSVTAEEFSTLYETNVGGYLKTTQAAVPHLRDAGGGRIIYVSSGLARTGNDIFGIYGGTKWAVNGLAKSAALAYGRDGIMCNVVAPGLVRTPFADNAAVLAQMMPGTENPTFDAVSEMIAQSTPIGIGHLEPEEVAASVMFFTTDATKNMTGEVLDVSYGSAATSVA
ncbi:SDR family NAD(P)-dependent oxidoreductase [Jannaschia aquimarina]|uniref:Putative short-chain type dehydrogenase/reductase n=1 Tax=Jannaschia aquimarina TaxID=935700 RepID=A0A0D1EBZ8_9RHOB|nr:SDR family NAD(P)-dependent oxidoreductase [Jannaschia aquimarina]KIT14396.1 putative short-chain type dehydrogenase/reductase [Jannaschia aquimarina]SNT42550.1 NAD(P)-dependent dehydrogenase, short-chain alcohol dehydrogenase family [Jannaschia aquimarina]